MNDEPISKEQKKSVNRCRRCNKHPHWTFDYRHRDHVFIACGCRGSVATERHREKDDAVRQWNAMNPTDGSKPLARKGILDVCHK